ncbi:MAG: site-2 protease family protein [Clostridia bacterium]
MLLQILRGGDMMSIFVYLISTAFVVFCTLPVHEFAHGWMANKMGDPTARLSGRLTLNPMKHLDLIGSILIFLTGFGWAKPVPVNQNNFRNPKKGMALTALAGPVSNLIMAFIFMLLMNFCGIFHNMAAYIFLLFFQYAALVNIRLAVFNLLPVPPLDGSRIFWAILPDKYYWKVMQYERIIMLVLFALLLFGVLSWPLSWLSNLVYRLFNLITGLPFRFF